MKIRKRSIYFLIIGLISIFFINLILSKSNRGDLRGNIIVWSKEESYNYFLKVADEFKKNNKKVNIRIVNIGNNEYFDKIINSKETDLPNVAQLNFIEIEKIKEKIDFLEENKSIIEAYSKNFNDSRIQEVKINENYYGIPFQSNPIAMYVRSDILHKYGYDASELNTWKDLIKVGIDIKNKSSGEMNIFSRMDKQNIQLLITSQLANSKDTIYTKDGILNELNKIYNDEFLTDDNNYLFRLASLDFYEDITYGNQLGTWVCKNPPSYKVGENKLYDIGGESLVALNTEKNREAVKEFIAFAATNKDLLSKELIDNKFFPSSLYSLNIKDSEEKNINIEGNSPFLVLTNIVERAPIISNYEKLKEVLYEIYYN